MIGALQALAFLGLHALCLTFFAAAAYGLGRRIMGDLPVRSLWEEAAFALTLGLGSLGTLFFAAGLVHALRRGVVVAVLIASIGLGWRPLRHLVVRLRGIATRQSRTDRLLMAGFAVFALSLSFQALYPPGGWDALMYHLPAARAFAAAHSLPVLPQLRYPVFPQWNEVLWAAALLVCDDVLAQLLSYLFMLVVLSSLAGLAARFENRIVAAWGVGIWLSSPIIFHLGSLAYVETAMAAFATLSLGALLAWREDRDRRWLILAGLLAGFAAATKYPGLFFVAALPIVILVEAKRGERLGGLARFALAASLAALPWYARLCALAGNPVWPFLEKLFGYRFWSPGDLASAVWTLKREGWPGAPLYTILWDLAFRQPSGEGRLSPLVFGLFPVGAILALRRGWGRWAVGVVAAYLLFWFYTTQQVRFLSPILPTVCFLAAGGGFAVARWVTKGRIERHALMAAALGLALLAGPQLLRSWRRVISWGPLPVTSAERESYLVRRFSTYPFYQQLNAARGSRYVVYAFHDESMKYYCEGVHFGDWFGQGRYSDIDRTSGASLFRSLKKLKVDFLLVDDRAVATTLPNDEFFRRHFVLMFERPGILGFELR